MQGQGAVGWTRRSGITALVLLFSALLAAPAGAWSDAATTPTTTTTTEPPGSSDDDASPSTATTTTTVPVDDTADPAESPASNRDAWLAGDGGDVGATAGSFTVTPSTGLGYSQSVTVAGTGYGPNSFIGAVQCVAGATEFSGCDLSFSVAFTNADATGAFTVPMTVHRFLPIAGGFVDCADAPGTCVVGAGPTFAASILDTAPLAFDPSAPIPPVPALIVTPDTDLGLVTQVSITGTGFVPNQFALIRQCRVGSSGSEGCNVFGAGDVQADGAGEIALDFEVRRGMRLPSDAVFDCLDAPGCELVASSFTDPFLVGHAPLAFDPSVPAPPPPVVLVTPNSGLADQVLITVSASGFAPHDPVIVGQCPAGLDPFAECAPGRFMATDDAGVVELTMRADRFSGPANVDCATTPGQCVVYAASLFDVFGIGTAPLEFDPNAPSPPPPVVTVTPATGLHDGDSVTVTGSGFAPDEFVGMIECRTVPLISLIGVCGFSTGPQFFHTDGNGGFQRTFTVRRTIRTADLGTIDCARDEAGCMIAVAANDEQFDRASAPLQFEPDPADAAGGLPRTGAPAAPLAALGGGLCLVGALFLMAVRPRPARDRWHAEATRPCKGDCDAGRS